jgi:hypothetical protein
VRQRVSPPMAYATRASVNAGAEHVGVATDRFARLHCEREHD